MEQQYAIITGASQGIGAAIALKLAAEGFFTVLLARSEEKLQKIVHQIQQNGGNAIAFPCDVSNSAVVEEVLEKIVEKLGVFPLVLVNNVGWGGPFHRTDEVSEVEWDQLFATNVKSAFLFCRRLLPEMKKQNFGRIINISSIYGIVGGAGSSTYTATKYALLGYTKSLAVEWGSFGITANCISPGYIATENFEINEQNAAYFQAVQKQVPNRQLGKPEHIADVVALLAKATTSYINGGNLVIDGGFTAGFNFLEN